MPYITTKDNVEIFFRDLGSGKPVVLIHGWPLTGDSWDTQANFLAENGLRVITYDRRGFGRSGQPWQGYDYDTMAADLHALIETLDLRHATLVGFSMGGGEVVRYLSRYGSSRIANAVLISAVPPYLSKSDDNPEGIDPKVFEGIAGQIRKDRADFFTDFASKFYGRTTFSHTVSDGVLESFQAMARTGTLRAVLATAHSWSSTDFRDEMKSITIPVRIIHGTSDNTVPIDVSGRRSVKLLPKASLTEYDGEPHGLTVTAADRLNAELLQFIGGAPEPITDPGIA